MDLRKVQILMGVLSLVAVVSGTSVNGGAILHQLTVVQKHKMAE